MSSFLTAHQHIIGYSVPYNGMLPGFLRTYSQNDVNHMLFLFDWYDDSVTVCYSNGLQCEI